MSQNRRSSIHGGGSPTLSGAGQQQHQEHQEHQAIVAGSAVLSHEGQIPRGIPLPGMVQPNRGIPHASPSHGFVNPLGPSATLAQVAVGGISGGSTHTITSSLSFTRSVLATATGMPIRPAGIHQGTRMQLSLYDHTNTYCIRIRANSMQMRDRRRI